MNELERSLSERAQHVQAIEIIDARLTRLGVRAIAKPKGRARERTLAIMASLTLGPKTTGQIAEGTGAGFHATQMMLSRMVKAGEVERVGRGVYGLAANGGASGKAVKR